MTFIAEIVRFVLPAQRAADFARVRTMVARHDAVLSQYYGPTMRDRTSLHVRPNEMCWVINWRARPTSFAAQLDVLGSNHGATSLLFEFEDKQETTLAKALGAPLCQFATINLVPGSQTNDAELQASMHKTYTDCFLAESGFTGGDWAYSINTNLTEGVPLAESSPKAAINPNERRLGVYFLGWTGHAAHDAYSATPLFDEEIDKLQPYFGAGTGAWYVKFEKHDDLADAEN